MAVHRAFNILRQRVIHIADRGRALLFGKILGRLNGQYERLMGEPAPGSNSLAWRGHDHSLNGGCPVGRHTVLNWDIGVKYAPNNGHTLAIDGSIKAFNTWHNVVDTRDVSDYFTPTAGLKGTKSSSPLTLWCRVGIHFNVATTGTVQFRINNVTAGAASSSFSVPNPNIAYSRLFFTNVPFVPGVRNGVNIQVQSNATANVSIQNLLLQEIENYSQPDQAGAVFTSIGRA